MAALAICALGTVVGFPLFLALALREVDAMHAAVVTGVLPLGTAVVGALVLRQRPPLAFWLVAALGCALVLGFAVLQGGGRPGRGDLLLLGAVVSTSIGYVAGARVSAELPAQQVICWVLVGSLPFTLPLALWLWPAAPASAAAWGGFAYVSVFSMWLGFFAWYRGLALGGVVRVSQVQLLQPFLALLFAVPVLGEKLEPVTLAFALAVLAVVVMGRRIPLAATTGSALR
jgi:drug/metabolite transporter (DMT)-like permease